MIDLSKPYGGYEPLRSSALQNRMARAIGAVCFFWMYYRVYHDAPVMMVWTCVWKFVLDWFRRGLEFWALSKTCPVLCRHVQGFKHPIVDHEDH